METVVAPKQITTVELFSVGEDFSEMTEKEMATLYEQKSFKAWKYKDVEEFLKGGNSINIRPATPPEMNLGVERAW